MAEEFKNVPEHETPKIATEESSETTTAEVKDRGMFDFLKKKEDVKPQETPLESELEHKAQISEPAFVAKHEEEENKENTHTTLLEKLHQAHEEEEENKPNLLQKLHRSNSSSSSSSDEEDKDGEKKKKEKKKKIVEGEEEKKGLVEKVKEKLPGHKEEYVPVVGVHVEGEEKSEEEKKGIMDKIKEKLPAGHGNKPEDDVPVVVGEPVTIPPPADPSVVEHSEEHPVEKKGILEKIKEKLPGYHAKSSGEEEMKVKESD